MRKSLQPIVEDRKGTGGKISYICFPQEALVAFHKQREFGFQKHGNRDTWMHPAPGDTYWDQLYKYADAGIRHGYKFDQIDPESGLPHVYAFLWNAAVAVWQYERMMEQEQFNPVLEHPAGVHHVEDPGHSMSITPPRAASHKVADPAATGLLPANGDYEIVDSAEAFKDAAEACRNGTFGKPQGKLQVRETNSGPVVERTPALPGDDVDKKKKRISLSKLNKE